MISKCAGCGLILQNDKDFLEHIRICDCFLNYLTITTPERQNLIHDEVFDVVVDFFSSSNTYEQEEEESFNDSVNIENL